MKNDTKRIFLTNGACSHTFFFILNREFGHLKDCQEKASDPLAGGIFQQGYQCGMLWGAALGAGAESFRRYEDKGQAIAHAITATQHLMKSFVNRTQSADCADITSCDFTSKFGLAKFLITGKPINCFTLAAKWTPEAIQSAKDGLSKELPYSTHNAVSCTSEVVKQMGGSEEEQIMAAGFAGGLGLSGKACGALSAAIWMNSLARVRKQSFKYTLSDPEIKGILNTFYEETDYEMKCSKICGQRFQTIAEHTEFIKNGGCSKLINVLADKLT